MELKLAAENCSICEKHLTLKDFVLFEDEELIISHWPSKSNEDLVYAGYCFIESKNHLTQTRELSDAQAQVVGMWLKKLDHALCQLLQAPKTYFFKFADITPHFHIHVYPRHRDTPKDLVGEAVRHWQGAPKLGRKEVISLCEKIRALA